MHTESLIAIAGLLVCLALLVRLAIGARRRARLDAALGRRWRALMDAGRAFRTRHRVRGEASREAQDLIERARRRPPRVDREGNVYRPRSFTGRDDDTRDGRHRRDH
jgi:hypothetical protein